jgi:hypothetical protein
MRGRQVLGAIALIVIATVVLPPAAAWTVNRHRVASAQDEANRLARLLRDQNVLAVAAGDRAKALCGPGRAPATSPAGGDWLVFPCSNLASRLGGAALKADPWGNSYIVKLAAPAPLVISAGPNGMLETSGIAIGLAAGDDIVGVNGPRDAGSSRSSEAR